MGIKSPGPKATDLIKTKLPPISTLAGDTWHLCVLETGTYLKATLLVVSCAEAQLMALQDEALCTDARLVGPGASGP